jgi:hypothetical protein
MPSVGNQIDVGRALMTLQSQLNGLIRQVATDMQQVENAINALTTNQKRLEVMVNQAAAIARSSIGGMGVGYGPGLAAPGMPGRVDVGIPRHSPSDAVVDLVGGSGGSASRAQADTNPFYRPVTQDEQDDVFYSGAED